MKNPFDIYRAIADNVPDERIKSCMQDEHWVLCETDSGSGLAMNTAGDSIKPMFPRGLEGLSTAEAAQALASWNFSEAGMALAAVNAAYNTAERLERLDCYEPFENYSTRGIDFRGRTVGLIGHLKGPKDMRRDAKEIYTLELEPEEGDYPASACDYLLPKCDIVIITGSSLVNKTLPHLLELSSRACTILTGPSVPMCPQLLDYGIDRIAGLVTDDREKLRDRVKNNTPGSPYSVGRPFLIIK